MSIYTNNSKKLFSDRLSNLLKERKITQVQLSKILGVQESTVGKWLLEKALPRMRIIEKLGSYFNVSKSYFLVEDYNQISASINFKPRVHRSVQIPIFPILNNIIDDFPTMAIDDYDDWEEISETMASQGEHFAIRMVGTSMEPEIYERDIVIIRKQSNVNNGDIALILINDEEATLKRVYYQSDGVRIMADNKRVFSDRFYSNKEFTHLKVLGKAIEILRELE